MTKEIPLRLNSSDATAVKQTCLDYVEGWYEGKAERMERALHPALQKRIVEIDPTSGKDRLREMSANPSSRIGPRF